MFKGKATCKILKDIRKQIADDNDIEFITSECTYQGDCAGTCPKCEAELRYLEEELRKRKQMGKTAIVAGISLSLATTVVSCKTDLPPTQVRGLVPKTVYEPDSTQTNNPNNPSDTTNTTFPTPPIDIPMQGEVIEQPTAGKVLSDSI